eukprot:scaffold9769_cov57-Phaeocystis_antarctica.AAC.1
MGSVTRTWSGLGSGSGLELGLGLGLELGLGSARSCAHRVRAHARHVLSAQRGPHDVVPAGGGVLQR